MGIMFTVVLIISILLQLFLVAWGSMIKQSIRESLLAVVIALQWLALFIY